MASFVALRNGALMPSIGLGTYLGKGSLLNDAIGAALDVGYRHIDTAMVYENEEEIGCTLAEHFKSGKIQRKNVFITTKVPPVYMAEEDVIPCVVEALEKLQVNYVDMLLIHAPFGSKNMGDGNLRPVDEDGNRIIANHDFRKTWKAMEKLVHSGSVRALGLSNFSTNQILEIMQAGTIMPENLQMECHAYLQQDKLRHFCSKNEIIVTGYSPLGAPGNSDVQHGTETKLIDDPVIKNIADELGRTPGQVLIKYVSHLGVVPLPKSMTPARIIENYEALHMKLSDEHVKRLVSLNKNFRYFTFSYAMDHPKFPDEEF